MRVQPHPRQRRTKKLVRLAGAEQGRIALLRHDFRRYYGCCYDEVPADEAADLVAMLPSGSAYVASRWPERGWSREQEDMATLIDELWQMALYVRGASLEDAVKAAPKVERPETRVATQRAKERAREVKARIESTRWEEA